MFYRISYIMDKYWYIFILFCLALVGYDENIGSPILFLFFVLWAVISLVLSPKYKDFSLITWFKSNIPDKTVVVDNTSEFQQTLSELQDVFVASEKRLEDKIKALEETIKIKTDTELIQKQEIEEKRLFDEHEQMVNDYLEAEALSTRQRENNAEIEALMEADRLMSEENEIVVNFPTSPEKYFFMDYELLKDFVNERFPTKSPKWKSKKLREYKRKGFKTYYSINSQCNPHKARANFKPKKICRSLNSRLVDPDKIAENLYAYASTYVSEIEKETNADSGDYFVVLTGYIDEFLAEFSQNGRPIEISEIWDESVKASNNENCVF